MRVGAQGARLSLAASPVLCLLPAGLRCSV
jgi:hypothetical protein